MRTHRLRLIAVVLLLIGLTVTLPAHNTPTPEELTLRPGDTVTWIPAPQHSLRFGGNVTHNGKPLALTAPADIEALLTNFKPPLPPKPKSGEDTRVFRPGEKVTATVSADAAKHKVAEFFFTCGVHPNPMVTMSFVIKPAGADQMPRTVEIDGGPGFVWFLKTPTGNKSLKRP